MAVLSLPQVPLPLQELAWEVVALQMQNWAAKRTGLYSGLVGLGFSVGQVGLTECEFGGTCGRPGRKSEGIAGIALFRGHARARRINLSSERSRRSDVNMPRVMIAGAAAGGVFRCLARGRRTGDAGNVPKKWAHASW